SSSSSTTTPMPMRGGPGSFARGPATAETPSGGGLYAEALTDKGAVLLRGTKDQGDPAKNSIEVGADKRASGAKSRTIELKDGGSAPILAEELGILFRKMRKNPVEVITPERLRDFSKPKPKPKKELPAPKEEDEKKKGTLKGGVSGRAVPTALRKD